MILYSAFLGLRAPESFCLLAAVGSTVPKAKVMFDRASMAVVDSEMWLVNLKWSDGFRIQRKGKSSETAQNLLIGFRSCGGTSDHYTFVEHVWIWHLS